MAWRSKHTRSFLRVCAIGQRHSHARKQSGIDFVILNVIDQRMSLSDAMRAPRIHHQALPDSLTFETNGISAPVRDSLRAMGYGLRELRALVNVNAIMRVRGGWEGVPEPRRSGGAVGY